MLFDTILWILSLIWLAAAENFTNPLRRKDGSDPFMVWHDGYYYLTTTTWKDVQLTRAKSIEGLKRGETRVTYRDGNPNRCCNVWAPEVHEIDGTWYMYFTAGNQQNLGLQRPHVIKGGPSPWGTYTYHGQLHDQWGIDGTLAMIASKRYFIWSCKPSPLQSLCIAPMTAPNKIGRTSLISEPTNSWEKAEGKLAVNEGPAVLVQNGKTFLAYSASYCWTASYSLGLLTLKDGGDPTNRAAWVKTGPVFKSANGNYGPGHNGFFKSPNGKEWWNVYHATSIAKGACDGNRYTMVDPVRFDSGGMPNFGKPSSLSAVIEGPSG